VSALERGSWPGQNAQQLTQRILTLGENGTFAGPPGLPAVEWVPAAEIAAALGVDHAVLGGVVHRANPRRAQLQDGSQQLQVDATKVWRLAESLDVAVPDPFAPASRASSISSGSMRPGLRSIGWVRSRCPATS
jgi:hypothetical protein